MTWGRSDGNQRMRLKFVGSFDIFLVEPGIHSGVLSGNNFNTLEYLGPPCDVTGERGVRGVQEWSQM